jgi:TRAP-type C4-dicarboxylate transport system permease small subunit
MRRVMNLVEHVVAACAALMLLVFTVLILVDIAFRYWLHIPLAWPTELTVLLFQWTAFLGAAIALRRASHFGLDLFASAMPAATQRVIHWVIVALTLAANVLLISVSLDMIAQQKFSSYPTLPFSHAVAYYGVLISACLMVVFTIEVVVSGPAHRQKAPDAS